MSRGDIKELGELLAGGRAALIVIAESRVEDELDKALTRAVKSIEKARHLIRHRRLSGVPDRRASRSPRRRFPPTFVQQPPMEASVSCRGQDTPAVDDTQECPPGRASLSHPA